MVNIMRDNTPLDRMAALSGSTVASASMRTLTTQRTAMSQQPPLTLLRHNSCVSEAPRGRDYSQRRINLFRAEEYSGALVKPMGMRSKHNKKYTDASTCFVHEEYTFALVKPIDTRSKHMDAWQSMSHAPSAQLHRLLACSRHRGLGLGLDGPGVLRHGTGLRLQGRDSERHRGVQRGVGGLHN